MAGKLTLETLTTVAELRRIESEWRDLATRCADDSAYLAPEFLLPWIEAVADKLQIAVSVAWQDDRLVALAPFMHRRLRKMLLQWRIKSFPVSGTTPAFDILMQQPERPVLAAMIDHWLSRDDWDFAWLHCVDRDSKVLEMIESIALEKRMSLVREPAITTWLLTITGAWQDYFDGRPKKIRNNSRRNWRNCEQWGQPSILRYPDEGLSLDEALGMAERAIQGSWKRIGDEEREQLQLLKTLARSFDASGQLWMRFLLIDGEVVAYLMEIAYRQNLFPFHNAYDSRYQRVSPGQLLLADSIKQAHEQGFGRVDFFGTMDYIVRWTDEAREYQQVYLVRPGLVARLKARMYHHIHRRRQLAAKAKVDRKKNQARLER